VSDVTFQIYIPTYKRTEKLIRTIESSPELKKEGVLVVRPEEEKHYKDDGFQVLTLPEGCEGLGAARQYIMERTLSDYVWMLDDDLNNQDLFNIIQYVTFCAAKEDAGIFGLGSHFMDYVKLEKDGEWTRKGYAVAAWGLNRKKYLQTGMDMREWRLCADIYCYAGMQVAGHKVLISNIYTAKQGHPSSGGCLTYRTADVLHSYFDRLEKTYPEYIRVVDSPRFPRTWYKSLRIQWAKIHKDIPRI
jgi:glycosyltransferase involved in cell wall biosynthesis